MTMLVLALAFLVLGSLALAWGTDSRDPMTDDHLR